MRKEEYKVKYIISGQSWDELQRTNPNAWDDRGIDVKYLSEAISEKIAEQIIEQFKHPDNVHKILFDCKITATMFEDGEELRTPQNDEVRE